MIIMMEIVIAMLLSADCLTAIDCNTAFHGFCPGFDFVLLRSQEQEEQEQIY